MKGWREKYYARKKSKREELFLCKAKKQNSKVSLLLRLSFGRKPRGGINILPIEKSRNQG